MAIGINLGEDGAADDRDMGKGYAENISKQSKGKGKKEEPKPESTGACFADILKVSKQGLTGVLQNRLTAVRGRIPQALSTGSIFLDYKLNGGFLPGHLQHLYGPSGSGKSTMTYRCIAANQRADLELLKVGMGSLPNFLPKRAYGNLAWRPSVICEAEGGLNEGFLQSCLVDLGNPNFAVFYPEHGEDWFHYSKRFCVAWWQAHYDEKSETLDPNYLSPITVIDSLANLIPKSLLDDEQQQIAFLARLLSGYLPITLAVNTRTKASTLAINQTRINPMAGPYGNPETTKGGPSPFYAASGNFRVSRTGKDEDLVGDAGERVRQYNFKFAPKKCRWAPVTGDAYELMSIMGFGFSRLSDMWNFGLASGQVKQSGAWYELEVIGRPDLNTEKKWRQDDLVRMMREKNLWEVFVMQVFSGAAWGGQLDRGQLEILGAVTTTDAPDNILPEEEIALQQEAENQRIRMEVEAANQPGML